MDAKIKLVIHILISTFAFSLLLYFVLLSTVSIENAMIFQGVILGVLFLVLEAPSFISTTKELQISKTEKREASSKASNLPSLKEIILIFTAIILAVLLAILLIKYDVDINYLLHAAGVIVLATIWNYGDSLLNTLISKAGGKAVCLQLFSVLERQVYIVYNSPFLINPGHQHERY